MLENKPSNIPDEDDELQKRIEEHLQKLPRELQKSLREFYLGLAQQIISQETRLDGDKVSVKLSPDRVAYYGERLSLILDSQFFNPHLTKQKKITE